MVSESTRLLLTVEESLELGVDLSGAVSAADSSSVAASVGGTAAGGMAAGGAWVDAGANADVAGDGGEWFTGSWDLPASEEGADASEGHQASTHTTSGHRSVSRRGLLLVRSEGPCPVHLSLRAEPMA